MKAGLYEEIISELLNNEFQKPENEHFLTEKEKIDENESHIILSKYLSITNQDNPKYCFL
jgi:hypothetical protein